MLFHVSASVSPQEGEEHRAAPTIGDALIHSGRKPKGEAYCTETFSSGIEIYGITTGDCRERDGNTAADCQKMALVVFRSSPGSLKMALCKGANK